MIDSEFTVATTAGVGDRAESAVIKLQAPTSGRITLRQLIARKVGAQVAQYHESLAKEAETPKRPGAEYLDAADIRDALEQHGELRNSARGRLGNDRLDPDAEVELALAGFERQRYIVLVDGTQVLELDEEFEIHPGSKVEFLRLVPLVGG